MQPFDTSRVGDAQPVPWDPRTAYERWCAEQAIPIVTGFHIPDLTAVELKPWTATGALGAILQIDGTEETNGAYLLKVQSGESSAWQKRMFEELFYVVAGEGVTEVRGPGGAISTCRWKRGSAFAVPLNFEYRHIAQSGDALFYCVNSAPLVMNLFHSDRFVFDNPFTEFGRFDGSTDFFSPNGTFWDRSDGATIWETNLIEDARALELPLLERRGAGSSCLCFEVAEGTLASHISQFPSGSYKKAHRHGPGAHVVMLGGTGYTLLWKSSLEDAVEVKWTDNSILVPPSYWFHQHFNVGDTPARYLALRWGSWKHRLNHDCDGVLIDRRSGGDQIEYDDEDPAIRERFDARRAATAGAVGATGASRSV